MPIFKCAGTQRFDDAGEPLCDHEDKKRWFGACPGCGRFWNIIKYDTEAARRARRTTLASAEEIDETPRVATGFKEFDDLTSGGLPEGSVVVISGPAGAGKTTLNLLLAAGAAQHHRRKCALYASAEETNTGLLEKAKRCGLTTPDVELMGSEGNIYNITARAEALKPGLLIIDSLQEMYLGNDTRPDRIMEILRYLKKFCVKEKIACLVVAHVSRTSGEVRGPTSIDHFVDAMLEFDPRIIKDKNDEIIEATRGYRKLTLAMKTRIGPPGSRFFNMTTAGVITPLDEDTYYGRKKKRTAVGDDSPPKPRNLKLVEKYRKPVES